VFDVARYILEQQGAVTTLKLQKLVYYAQAWAVAKGDPLFDDAIKAWAQGPVVPALFHQHKGRRQITAADMTSPGQDLTEPQREHIDEVLAHYGGRPPKYLSELTHFERPWADARAEGHQLGYESPAISVEAMRAFYGDRTPEDLEADFQLSVARKVMQQHERCLARLAL
jgi:uncharacterized phage-associated protein